MASDEEKTPGEEVAKIDNPAVKSVPTKEKIPPKNIIYMLTNDTLRKGVMPLLEDVLVKISKTKGLDEDITNVIKTTGNAELTQALTTLQDKLQSIYYGKEPRAKSEGGGKRRRTKKRKHYKKRRSTKHR